VDRSAVGDAVVRIRSRQVETESVNARMLQRGSVTRTAITPRSVGALEMLPPSNRLPAAVIEELDERSVGETVTVTVASQEIDAAGEELEWEAVAAAPAQAGFDTLSVPATELPQTYTGAYYNLSLEFTAPGAGTVEVYQDDVLVGEVPYTSGAFWRVFPLGAR
jgi:hypothetical protein